MSQEGFLGEIKMFGGNFPPRSWAFCEGQLMAISQNQALFSILGTIYGGDGRTTFALPDLRGRVAISSGNGPGLSSRQEGSKGGSETNHLTAGQLPTHDHTLVNGTVVVTVDKPTATATATSITDKADLTVGQEGMGQTAGGTPDNNYLGISLNHSNIYRPNPGTASIKGVDVQVSTAVDVDVTAPVATIGGKTSMTGSSQSVNNMQPFLAVYYIICIEGTFPNRS